MDLAFLIFALVILCALAVIAGVFAWAIGMIVFALFVTLILIAVFVSANLLGRKTSTAERRRSSDGSPARYRAAGAVLTQMEH